MGEEAFTGTKFAHVGFDIVGIQALVITHLHLDHVGRISALLAAGFSGPILCSEPSARLLPVVLEDAYKLGISVDPSELERYLALLRRMIVPLPLEQWHHIEDHGDVQCSIRLQRAGHLLGSAYVECDVRTRGARVHGSFFQVTWERPPTRFYARSSRQSGPIFSCSGARMVIGCMRIATNASNDSRS